MHAEEDVREVVQEGAPFQLSPDDEEGALLPDYTLSEVQEALETWWPSSSVFDFDAAYEAAKKKAKRPLGLWGVEVEDRKEVLRLLNLEMERFVAKVYAKLRASDPILSRVSLLSDWNVLLLVRQQLTRDRVKTRLTDQEIDEIFEGAPRLYPWLPRDVTGSSNRGPLKRGGLEQGGAPDAGGKVHANSHPVVFSKGGSAGPQGAPGGPSPCAEAGASPPASALGCLSPAAHHRPPSVVQGAPPAEAGGAPPPCSVLVVRGIT
ncbi:hypothetical protein ACSSS7_007934 [Eimeria intestinalis]